MIHKRVNIHMIILILMISIFITSCSMTDTTQFESNQTSSDDACITLRFISSWGGPDGKAEVLENTLNEFMEENHYIEVINESMFGEDFLIKIKTDFASGNSPDVFALWPGSDINILISSGKVADLTGILNKYPDWKDTFNEDMWEFTTHNGKKYGLPLEIIYEGLFINKDLFEKHNVKIPETYEELKQAITTFRRNAIIPIAYNSQAEGTFLYQIIICMLGGKAGVEEPIKDGSIDSSYIEAMNYMIELYKMKAFPSNAFTLDNTARNNLFIKKKAAMIAQGSWFIGQLCDENTVDIIPFPAPVSDTRNSSSIIYGLGNGVLYMSQSAWEDAEKREASILLLQKLTSAETATAFAERTGMLSNVKIDYDIIGYGPLVERGLKLLESADEFVAPPDHFIDRSVWEGIIVENFPYVLEGHKGEELITPEMVWDEALEYLE